MALVEPVNRSSSSTAKLTLFRSLFRGREDVYPRRWENPGKGTSGYSPVCANEWVPGICGKPTVKCSLCAHRRYLPVTDEVIRHHILGEDKKDRRKRPFVVGIYPLLQDDTCWFLAIDFDKVTWREDALACVETCRRPRARGGA